MNPFLRCLLLALAAGATTAAGAQDTSPDPAVATVNVTTTRDPVDKSYRKMIKVMERFER